MLTTAQKTALIKIGQGLVYCHFGTDGWYYREKYTNDKIPISKKTRAILEKAGYINPNGGLTELGKEWFREHVPGPFLKLET